MITKAEFLSLKQGDTVVDVNGARWLVLNSRPGDPIWDYEIPGNWVVLLRDLTGQERSLELGWNDACNAITDDEGRPKFKGELARIEKLV